MELRYTKELDHSRKQRFLNVNLVLASGTLWGTPPKVSSKSTIFRNVFLHPGLGLDT